MREIKFRYYCLTRKSMIYGYEMPEICNEPVSQILVYNHGIQSKTLMQYTGIKDILGKEVYEGDLLCKSMHGPPIEVVFDTKHSCFKCKDEIGLLWVFLSEGYYVVGNIYETPELLNKEK